MSSICDRLSDVRDAVPIVRSWQPDSRHYVVVPSTGVRVLHTHHANPDRVWDGYQIILSHAFRLISSMHRPVVFTWQRYPCTTGPNCTRSLMHVSITTSGKLSKNCISLQTNMRRSWWAPINFISSEIVQKNTRKELHLHPRIAFISYTRNHWTHAIYNLHVSLNAIQLLHWYSLQNWFIFIGFPNSLIYCYRRRIVPALKCCNWNHVRVSDICLIITIPILFTFSCGWSEHVNIQAYP